ncbi:hypothetical protein LOD99_4513 [Oopsacas minuta]|uniref:Uncharacterized protein n=1 Tax=Oopsacas minuta TaxID=111878 RepID=A0AAV7JTE1_9METZ|nr:hypothetical protein LOD99_4513 [Oopsacas minuta]
MKTFFTILALFTFVTALAGVNPPSPTNPPPPPPSPPPFPCKARVPDDYFTTGVYRESIIDTLMLTSKTAYPKTYRIGLGEYMQAVYYTGNMSMFNETFTIIEGGTGKVISRGWNWVLVKEGVRYSMTSVNGGVTHCTRTEGYTVEKMSTIMEGLNTLYPIRGEPVDPNRPHMCEGILPPTERYPGCIMTVGWTPGPTTKTTDPLLFITSVSNTTSSLSDIREMRPLTIDTDKPLFNNPCKPSDTITPPPSVRWSGIARHLTRSSMRT